MSDEKPIYCGGCHTHWPSFKAWHDHNCQHKLSFSEQQIRTHGAKKARTEERVKLIIEERDQLQEENAELKAVVDAARSCARYFDSLNGENHCDPELCLKSARYLTEKSLAALDDTEKREE